MRDALKAYGWWVLGVLSAAGLGYLYHRRLADAIEAAIEPDAGGDGL